MSSNLKEDTTRLEEAEGIGAVLRKGYEDHNKIEKSYEEEDSKKKKEKAKKEEEDDEDEEDESEK